MKDSIIGGNYHFSSFRLVPLYDLGNGINVSCELNTQVLTPFAMLLVVMWV